MATPIKVGPVLTGAAARRFDRRAAQASKRKGTIDCSEAREMCKAIIAKARANGVDI
jgi:hypothetical protein